MGAPAGRRRAIPEHSLLARDHAQPSGFCDDDGRGMPHEIGWSELYCPVHRRLFVRREEEGHRNSGIQERPRGRQSRDAPRLHVRGPATVEEVAVPRTEFPGPAGRDRDGIEMAVEQDAARAARRRDRLHVRMRGRLETEFLNRCRRGSEDGAHVRVRSGGNADELGEGLPDGLDQVHAPLRSSSLCTIAIAWSACNATGPRPTARTPRSLRHPSSSAASSWLSESTKVASAGRAACRISLPPSLRATNVGPRRASASENVAMEPYTPGENSCSTRDGSTRVCRISEAFERMSGW